MGSDDVSMASSQDLRLFATPSWGLFLLQLGAVLLAVVPVVGQSWLPSRQELEVMAALDGRSTNPLLLQEQDYVEWQISPCYGSCAAYRVRLDRSGQVRFEGQLHTCWNGVGRRQVTSQQAAAVLAATAAALSQPVEDSQLMDASAVVIMAQVAGQPWQLQLSGLDGSASQQPVRRLLQEGERILMDPGWLPAWTSQGATCRGSNGERTPFKPDMEGLPP